MNEHLEITNDGLPEDVSGVYLAENADTFLGVRPLFGRMIEPFDVGQSVVVLDFCRLLAAPLRRRSFHVIGRLLEMDHAPYMIVGVMPRSFAFTDIAGVGDVYLPASLKRAVASGRAPSYIPWIKLRPHVTVAAANVALEPIVREILKIHSVASLAYHLGLQPIIVPYQQNLGRTLGLLLAGVVLLLIIGCANCSILLLARGRTRQHELAIRTAIGASRWRIVRQLLVEALVISCTGAVLGVAASYWLARLPLLLSPDSFPAESVIRINASVLAFSVALALLCGILSVSPPRCVSRATILRALSRAGRLAWSLLLQGVAGASHRGAGRPHASSYGHRGHCHPRLCAAHADAPRLRSRQCHAARHLAARRQPGRGKRPQSREARAAYIEQIREKIASVPRVSTVAVGVDATPPGADVQSSLIVDGSGDGEEQRLV